MMQNMDYSDKKDVFIGHASEDKMEYVYPLVEAFKLFGITYWLDEAEIKWGESIVEKINNGILNSQFVLFLLSESFLKKRWPKKEINAALSLEIFSGEIKVLPLLIAPQKVIFTDFPIICDKYYINWQDPITISKQVLKLLKRDYKNKWEHNHPKEYSGRVWIRIMPLPMNEIRIMEYEIKWGNWEFHGKINSIDNRSVLLHHRKGSSKDSIPLFFTIKPPCFVTFGIGETQDSNLIDINEGWKRVLHKNNIKR